MRAVVLHEARLAVEEVPSPVPGPGQVLLDVARAGICGSDLHARLHADAAADIAAQVGYESFARPGDRVVLGHEFVGRVRAYGPGCRARWPVGTALVALPLVRENGAIEMTGLSPRAPGAYAEQVLVWEDAAIPVPDGVPDDLAALTEPLAVAVHAVNRGSVRRRDTALVVGCGPIGLAVVLVLRARGVRHVVASDPAPARRELARRCGAHVVVDPSVTSPWAIVGEGHLTSTPDLYGQALDVLKRLRAVEAVPWPAVVAGARTVGMVPRGPVVFECVGVPGVIEQVVTGAPLRSRVVVVGVCMTPDAFRPTMAVNKELDLRFSFCYDPAEFADALRLIASGRVDAGALVTGVVGLDDVAQTFDDLATAGPHAKVLVDPHA